MKLNTPITKTENLITQEFEDELLIYDLGKHKVFNLNQTAALVWQNSDGTKEVREIAQAIQKKLGKPVSEQVVWLALEGLKKEELVNFETNVPEELKGLSRRDVIKKIGLTSMVALPLVIGMVAPLAIHGASLSDACDPGGSGGGIGNDPNKTRNGGACMGHGNCCSNRCCPTAGGGHGVCVPRSASC